MARSRKRDAASGLGAASIDTGRRASAYERIKEATSAELSVRWNGSPRATWLRGSG